MTLGLQRPSSRDDFDLELLLEKAAAKLLIGAAPTGIRDGKIRHRSLPTRSAILDFPETQVYYVLMHARSGRGYVLGAMLTRSGGELSAQDVADLETSVASLRYDATRVCKPGPDGTTVHEIVRPPPARHTDSGKDTQLTKGQLATRRAMMGCQMLIRLFVPVDCMIGKLDGSRAIVASFSDSDERSAKQNLETFRDRVVATYCWAAPNRKLPRLAFAIDERSLPVGEVEPIRSYSCKVGGWTEAYPPGQFEFDPSVYGSL